MEGIEIEYNNKVYTVTDEDPKNHDKVLTDNYGVWEFFDEGGGTAPIPYWANKKTCMKILAIDGVSL